MSVARAFITPRVILIVIALCLTHTFASAKAAAPDRDLLAAASAGAPAAQFDLAEHYFRSEKKNLPAARVWYAKAARQGHIKAKALLGYFLVNGVGGDAELEEGLTWYTRAARDGSHMAQFNLGLMYETGRGVTKDAQKAISLYKQASKDPRYSEPQYRIALMYELGAGVRRDFDLAKKWYIEAQNQGHPDAPARLAQVMVALSQAAQRDQVQTAKLKEIKKIELPEGITDVPVGPTIQYKGRLLIGSAYNDVINEPFFRIMKSVIDRLDNLPDDLRKYPDLIRFIQYDPSSKTRQRRDYSIHVATAYAPYDFSKFPAPVLVSMNADWISQLDIATSLSGAGYLASLHKRLLDLRQDLSNHRSGKARLSKREFDRTRAEHNDLVGYFKGTDQEAMRNYECALTEYQTQVKREWSPKSPEVLADWRERPTFDCFKTKLELPNVPPVRKATEQPIFD